MGDAVVVVAVIVVVALALWPALVRWLARNPGQPLVDPDQDITVNPIDGLPGIYETNYRPRRLPGGAPQSRPARRGGSSSTVRGPAKGNP